MVVFWYVLVPVVGAFISRHAWRVFRKRFDELRLRPLLDYGHCQQAEEGAYRFIGGFESITDGHTLWVKSDTLTIPVALAGAYIYILPIPEDDTIPESFDPGAEVPERIRWDQISVVTEGARVFVGGPVIHQAKQWRFVSSREHPLLIIFYDGNDRSLTARAIRAGRHKNEYWNAATPYAFIAGTFCQISMAVSFLSRPAFRLTTITAMIALFIPLLPFIPPAFLCTVLSRRIWKRAKIFRAYRDLARLPLIYMPRGRRSGTWECRLPEGERYGVVYYASLPAEALEIQVPLLIPETENKKAGWYIFGSIPEGSPTNPHPVPREPLDCFATFGGVPGNPVKLALRYTIQAYLLELGATLLLLTGIGINLFFIVIIMLALI
ncbi:MAG: hypothetical protein LBT13_10875 [Treponema sp.]|jgi:hypothetical protein|nr:hypothetical protein [Treponema sp.]